MSVPRIAPELADLPHVPVTALEPLQGNLKELTRREYNKLKKSIVDYGLIVPFFVWQEAGKLLDGHQRQRVMRQEGWELDVPVVYISAADEQDAKRKLLVVSSQYGRVTQEGWDEFTWDLDDGWLQDTVHFDALPFVFNEYNFGPGDDPNEHWKGMPEFEQEDKTAYKSIHVHFKNESDFLTFCSLVGQDIGNMRSIWYPEAEKIDMTPEYHAA